MNFSEKWQEALAALKVAITRHIRQQSDESRAGLDSECGKFQEFVIAYRGPLQSLPAASLVVDRYNAFVAVARGAAPPGSVTSAVEQLLDAIDGAIQTSVSATGGNTPLPNPWVAGSFLLVTVLSILFALFLISRGTSVLVLPPVLIGAILLTILVDVTLIRLMGGSDKSFMESIRMVVRSLPLLRNKEDTGDRAA